METITIKCDRCTQDHSYNISQKDLESGMTLNIACFNIKRLPKITSTRIDFRKNALSSTKENIDRISYSHGSQNADEKIKRMNEVNEPRMWLIYDFDQYFEEIINTYIIGSFYPTATSCTTLAERLVNLFILKLRDLYDKSILENDMQKYVYTRDQSWQSYDSNMKVLKAWGLLTDTQKELFKGLRDIRNRAVHFHNEFDAKSDALTAIKTLHKILDSYFSTFVRKDVLRVFEIPGEIWVREDKIDNPFVKVFVLPCSSMFASCGAYNTENIYHENSGLIGIFAEDEFIKQRLEYSDGLKENRPDLEYKPEYKTFDWQNMEVKYRII